jgi:hypothetical protein
MRIFPPVGDICGVFLIDLGYDEYITIWVCDQMAEKT